MIHRNIETANQPLVQSPNLKFTSQRTIFVALPAYNEELELPSLLPRIKAAMEGLQLQYQVVVVDDASTDSTSEVAHAASEEMPLELVRHRVNKGLSGALETCIRTCMRVAMPNDIIITMDADDTHSPATIQRMLLKMDEGYDIVIASRYQPGSRVVGVPFNRLMMTWFARHLFKMAMPIPGVRDYTCGYRAYSYEALKTGLDHYGEEFVSEKGFTCMVDVLLKLRRFNLLMGEVPMLLRYDRKLGASKMKVASTATRTLKLLLKRRLGGY